MRNLAQNLNTLSKNLPTIQYELGFKCPHAEGLIIAAYLVFPSKYCDLRCSHTYVCIRVCMYVHMNVILS